MRRNGKKFGILSKIIQQGMKDGNERRVKCLIIFPLLPVLLTCLTVF